MIRLRPPVHPSEREAPIHVGLTRLGSVTTKEVRWLWPGRLPLGKVTLLVGDPGRGKSLLALDMAARVTRGSAWPDPASGSAPLGNVVLLSAEDDVADTILPRLRAAGGDPNRVIVLHSVGRPGTHDDRLFSLSRDMQALELAIGDSVGARLVVLDPVSAYLTGVDAHSNSAMRAVLAPLCRVAERRGVAVVAISHMTKKADATVLYRAMGSLAFVAASRAVWAVGPDRQEAGRLLFLPVKCNLVGGATGLAYRIVPSAQRPDVPVLAWEPEPVAMTAEEGLDVRTPAFTRRQRAVAWLEGLLSAGPMPAQEVERRAQAAGFSLTTVKRARHELGVIASHAAAASPWILQLPGWEAPEAQQADGAPATESTAPALAEQEPENSSGPLNTPRLASDGGEAAVVNS